MKGQEKVEQILQDIKEQVNLDEKAPPTSKMWNNLSLGSSALACIVFVVYVMIFLLAPDETRASILNAFNVIFFVEIALVVPAIALAVKEMFRNLFLSSVLSLVLCVLVGVCVAIFMVSAYQQYSYTLFSTVKSTL